MMNRRRFLSLSLVATAAAGATVNGLGAIALDPALPAPILYDPRNLTVTELDILRRAGYPRVAELEQASNPMNPYIAMAKALQADPEMAWGYHCNLAMVYYDHGIPTVDDSESTLAERANWAAAQFMKLAWSVDMTKHPYWVFGDNPSYWQPVAPGAMAPMRPVAAQLEDIESIASAPGNWDYDGYMHGMANGIILARSIVLGHEPKFLEAPTTGYTSSKKGESCESPDVFNSRKRRPVVT